MKTPIVLLLITCAITSAQTNLFITFTNISGIVVSNAEVVSFTANKLVYLTPTGGGTVKLANLPPEIQQRFAYNSNDAAATDQAENVKRAEDSEKNAKYVAAMEKYNRLKNLLLQGSRRVRGTVLQKISDGLLVDSGAAEINRMTEMQYGINSEGNEIFHGGGTVIEGNTPGALVLHLVLLQDYPQESMTDEGHVDVIAYPVGLYAYNTVNNSSKTVRKFSCNLTTAIRELALQEQQ